ncbi:MAG: four helix bundle protein [Acidimicrobiia bacterium]|nr:four helix bundle protein [Acidimicrobiia bacterium]
MSDFRKLEVWQLARRLVADLYVITEGWPRSERYGLASQIQRAGVSIAANVAEGSGRKADGDFRRFVDFALGSASEVECLLILAGDLNLSHTAELETGIEDVRRVRRMLIGLRRSL